ncbi:hypothetical protein [Mucilaginibacter sp. 10I4]|nr:hypothetical protein [Mucilaginibacter sp. 10I4]MEB0262902.1 hypothetical protein [Mucilaginibacter sp. 10I4]
MKTLTLKIKSLTAVEFVMIAMGLVVVAGIILFGINFHANGLHDNYTI